MKPIDFQGIVSLDQPLVDQLHCYLQEKESQVSNSILSAIHTLPRESLPPVLPYSTSGQVKLADAVEAFSKNVQNVTSSKRPLVPSNDWESATTLINNALWEYVEVLEGCITELFQQLGQVGFEQWHPELMTIVDQLKDMLNFRLEELGWKIRRLESLLWDFRWACEARGNKNIFLRKILFFWQSLLDRSLLSYIRKSRKLITVRYKWFSQRYGEYQKLKAKIEQSMRKFKGYHVFKSLEKGIQDEFKRLYQLLKLWEHNLKSNALPQREPVRALRNAFSIDKATDLFNEYYETLRNTLFERSRKFKSDPNELYIDSSSRRIVDEVLKGFCAEIHTLGVAVGKYRDFFLGTHPNPYVRTRWGFAEWIVGPEPSQTKNLLHLVYKIEKLDKLFEQLRQSLKKGPSVSNTKDLAQQHREIQRTLHEMGQPLSSFGVMRSRAEKILAQIQQMDELGSFNSEVVGYVGRTFSKALRADWQYHVLFDIPLFYQLYTIHRGVLGPIEDRQHLNRMNKFNELIEQLEGWVDSRDTYRHVHEIETDMTDIKGYLQDFLAYVQRVAKDDSLDKVKANELITEISDQLLEYRFAFGKFFHYLHQHEPEGKLIRNQFLFIDQYFESVENKLHEMRNKWE
ncbi:MAG: hypothetical protein K940chlam7_01984 [Chlamydiae bacterium]|nr:hypothetical protein [Chlamydiota bacterium]